MKSTVTLADLGEVEIVVPLGMLSEHVEGAHENNPPAMNTSTESNVTSPSTTIDCLPRRSDRGQIPRRRVQLFSNLLRRGRERRFHYNVMDLMIRRHLN